MFRGLFLLDQVSRPISGRAHGPGNRPDRGLPRPGALPGRGQSGLCGSQQPRPVRPQILWSRGDPGEKKAPTELSLMPHQSLMKPLNRWTVIPAPGQKQGHQMIVEAAREIRTPHRGLNRLAQLRHPTIEAAAILIVAGGMALQKNHGHGFVDCGAFRQGPVEIDHEAAPVEQVGDGIEEVQPADTVGLGRHIPFAAGETGTQGFKFRLSFLPASPGPLDSPGQGGQRYQGRSRKNPGLKAGKERSRQGQGQQAQAGCKSHRPPPVPPPAPAQA